MGSTTAERRDTRKLVVATVAAVAVGAVVAALAVLLSGGDASHTAHGPKLSLHPPKLRSPQTVYVSANHHLITLKPHQDYVIKMPTSPLRQPLSIAGGHNVVVIGGEIDIGPKGRHASIDARRGLLLKGQTGVAHVEGLLIRGKGLTEGIDLDQRLHSTVQIENVRVVGVHARDQRNFTDNHPDVIQTWAGPSRLFVDRLTASTDYQGLFLNPQQFGGRRNRPRLFDFRHVNIAGLPTARYLLWRGTPFRMRLSDVWVKPARRRPAKLTMWPSPEVWTGVQIGTPGGGDFVPADSVGVHYKSPGYTR
jgi:hypothetical protein